MHFNLSGAEDGLYKVKIKNGHERYRKMELQ